MQKKNESDPAPSGTADPQPSGRKDARLRDAGRQDPEPDRPKAFRFDDWASI